jgi:leader peptidase (prepilin peptidase)/N-methyltransferase
VVGPKLAAVAIFLSALIALPAMAIVGKRDFQLPFIPFLAISLFIVYLNSELFLGVLQKLYG